MQPIADLYERGLSACLGQHFTAPVAIRDLRFLTGGASRIIARFTADIGAGDDIVDRHLILRLDPPSSFVESDRAVEFGALKALTGLGLPIPEPVFLDAAGAIFGRPFLVMSEIPSGRAAAFSDTDPYGEHAAPLGRALFHLMGRIAAIDVDTTGITAALPPPGANPCATQLEYWEQVIDGDEISPQPIVRAGIRALRRRLPSPPQKLSIVHGDARSGNFLVDGSKLTALLDWEFVHLGDALEDMAWCADPLWGHKDSTRVGAMLPLEEAITAWQAGSGLDVEPARLEWWRLFSAIKGMAMWTSAAQDFLRPGGGVASMASAALNCAALHETVIARTLWRWNSGE